MSNTEIETKEVAVWQHDCGGKTFFIGIDSCIYCSECYRELTVFKVTSDLHKYREGVDNGSYH